MSSSEAMSLAGAKQKDKKSEKRRAEHEAGQPHAAATEETHPAGLPAAPPLSV